MNAREVLANYYVHANDGDWDSWCDLFAEDMVMDEQLAGRIEGRERLRSMMRGMGAMYASFENLPRYFLVDAGGEEAAVVSHISARSSSGRPIEADVMNYFRIHDGRITYMSNHHDTLPFQVLSQSSGL
ncbi:MULTISPECIES: nuclear transport factor 2 family protein [Kitasatospora]|uniref:Nuclear transport factor 2 family protein n=1 Tax=Kitasatospora cathayae TaxID=3004092 RepID=A0ABY7PY90_9ACTN|nr:nuclear transport factor 2 family protein [Kitasatospora sp. HUAS 3-15]WBP85147.1 nuclear transport factor 2 family protein [Kitasatospora sp. HUAS 3-15]